MAIRLNCKWNKIGDRCLDQTQTGHIHTAWCSDLVLNNILLWCLGECMTSFLGLGVPFFSSVFLLPETKYLLHLFSSLWIILGPLSLVFSVETFAYFGIQIPSHLKNRQEYLQQVLSFSQFIFVASVLQQRPTGFLVLSSCKKRSNGL